MPSDKEYAELVSAYRKLAEMIDAAYPTKLTYVDPAQTLRVELDELAAARATVAQQAGQIAVMRNIVERLEWSHWNVPGTSKICPMCLAEKDNGHESTCTLAAALAADGSGEGKP